MITCPWCGSSYEEFQSFCNQCGGSLPEPAEEAAQRTDALPAIPPAPPPPPRSIPPNTAIRMFLSDGAAIAGLVLLLLGLIFWLVGSGLTLARVTAFVGLPFAVLGILLLVASAPLLYWRLRVARRVVSVLEQGRATQGEVVDVRQELWLRVNGRHPWVVDYTYRVGGSPYAGKLTTLSLPDPYQRPGQAAWILYLGNDPTQSTLYPNPYLHPD